MGAPVILALPPAPAVLGYVNMAQVVSDLWPPLNATGPADAIFWTEAELYQWLDDAVNRMAAGSCAFIVYDTSLTTVLSQAAYTQPARYISILQADLAGAVLKARDIPQLEALDDAWPTTAGTPEAFILDSQGLIKILLYPVPDAGSAVKTIGQLMRYLPSTISVTNAILAAPQCLQEYFSFYALGEARAKESRAPMPEIASWFRGLTGMLDQVIRNYWGDV